MPRLNVWIDSMKLARIDKYCEDHKVKRSTLLTRGALSIVNAQPISKCDYCRTSSVGRFRISMHDWEAGEQIVEKNLCSVHLMKAKGESEVTEV